MLENAAEVRAAPESPLFHTSPPAITIESPVIVQIIRVSMIVPVILTIPCSTGSFV